MASLAEQGFKISKNALFRYLMQKATKLMGKPAKIGFLLQDAYKKLVNEKSAKNGFDQIRDIMFSFIRLVRAYIDGSYRDVSTKSVVIGIATLLYVVLPIDIIPDFIPVLGFADDISLMAWFIKAFQEELSKFQDWEHLQGIQPS
ncbi:YkvA family protein [Adhaeribacter aquaticus]|uniref:YkvA family protein n=1 Tax=Adhaeribacter aquaticus TaxID=299567 RepID=UPI000406E07A|nr:YkvA family protein [Adhaeribacter aquaticus]